MDRGNPIYSLFLIGLAVLAWAALALYSAYVGDYILCIIGMIGVWVWLNVLKYL